MADEDISSLTRALEHNRSVEGLFLSDNDCGEAGYRSILKTIINISSIKATIQSNTCLRGIDLPKENNTRDEYDSDSDESDYNARDGYEEIRDQIHSVLRWNRLEIIPRERIIQTHLNTRNHRMLWRGRVQVHTDDAARHFDNQSNTCIQHLSM